MVRDVSPETEEGVRQFLLAHADTSIYLLSGLRPGHPANLTKRPFGVFRFLEQDGEILAVLCLTPIGDLLVQTGGRQDLADAVLDACAAERVPITGIVAEWGAADSAWRILRRTSLSPTYESRQVVHRLDLDGVPTHVPSRAVRPLSAADFPSWQKLNTSMLAGSGWPVPPDPETWRPGFLKRTGAGYVWGAFDGAELVSMALLDTVYEHVGQIGNVYTAANRRRAGFGRAVLDVVIRDAKLTHKLERLVLFTADSNIAARRLYQTLGFTTSGEFGMFFGTPSKAKDTQDRSTP